MKMPWPKNSDYMEEPVYAWLKKEDGLDDLRQDLLKVFSESGKVTGKFVYLLDWFWSKRDDKQLYHYYHHRYL